MSPGEALLAATGRAAEYLGRNDLGVLSPGRRADLLVLDADPLEDIQNLRRISALYLGGEKVDREALSNHLLGR
jgi:imidazolonepropionase-like amidohydrolase